MSTIRANAILDASGGTNATINGITPVNTASVLSTFNATGDAPVYACRAWVNFNGTGTVAIRASGNVSSITDNGTGDYTVNFTTAMPDANYAVSGYTASSGGANSVIQGGFVAQTASAIRFLVVTTNSRAAIDQDTVCIAIFR